MVAIIKLKSTNKSVAIAEVENIIFKDNEFIVSGTFFNSVFYCVEVVRNGKEE